MKLADLVGCLLHRRILGDLAGLEVADVTCDSRTVRKGSLFIAMRGHTVDGHAFVEDARRAGAVAAVVEEPTDTLLPQIVVPDTRRASALLSAVFFRHPSRDVKVIGVTGTNGKTTVTHLIDHLLSRAGSKTGLIGTIVTRVGEMVLPSVNTTPEAVELQRLFARMREEGITYAIMEVSSHALELDRVAGTRFRTAVFTNLTQDHLDFHGSMEAYREAKGKLFSRLGNEYADRLDEQSFAVINVDDPAGKWMARQTVAQTLTYGVDRPADLRARNIEMGMDGTRFVVEAFGRRVPVHLRLPGRFSVYNALAALGAGLIEGLPLEQMAEWLQDVEGVPGRMERVDTGQPFGVVVDYAHTPDSLENVLRTLREFTAGRLIVVFGCGGDRDRGKRPVMGQIAYRWSDYAILTSDNPRTEDPERILDDIEAGLVEIGADPRKYERVTDRSEAIRRAVALAREGDVVLIAGKGHETYQIIGRRKYDFDDRLEAKRAIRVRMGESSR
ncbi:MAG: UDP-N-acetylmuramoyl-L-alanyl-D-glutamate--2,6-diaminopimelate ligase [Alicyclobacillaceae bacterium]|nr:UDP-N-acetylmuramoyl-L-alanyl-D-glutamate--2,6-diaminopimelate ligase [Alicyclobacillaceae bacterium]